MTGVLHILDRIGQSLALLEQRCADLEAENARLRQELATRDATTPQEAVSCPS